MSTPRTIPELDNHSVALTDTTYVAVHKDGDPEAQRFPVLSLRRGSGYNKKHVAAAATLTHADFTLITVQAIGVADPNVDGITWYHLNIAQNKTTGGLQITGTAFNVGDLIFVQGYFD